MNAPEHIKPLGPPQVLLIDLDNTLYDYEPRHHAALAEVAQSVLQKYRVTSEQFRTAWSSSRMAVKQRLGPTASSHSRLLYVKEMLHTLGLGSEIQSIIELERVYWNAFLRDIAPVAGVAAFLERVRVMGIPCLVVTDFTTEIQLRKVLALGIADLVDGVITSEEAGGDKITGLPYRLAAERLGTDGANIWMVGDDPVADIEASTKHIGSTAIQRMIPSGLGRKRGPSPIADAAFSRYGALTSVLVEATRGNRGVLR